MSVSSTEKIVSDSYPENGVDDCIKAETQSSANSSDLPTTHQPPPDGGLLAWSQVFAGHLVAINATGYTNTFGFFLSYYTSALQESPSNISWVGSIQGFIILFIAAWTGGAVDAGYFYHLAVTGLILQLIGIFMTSLVTEYWQLMLAQGICQGLGSGLVLTPAMTVVATYFSTKRAVAMCLVSSASATGGVIFPLIARQLLGPLGIGWTVRVIGFVCLADAAIALAILKPRAVPRKGGAWIALDSFRDAWYSLFAFAMFMVMLGLYFVYYYVSPSPFHQIGIYTHTARSRLTLKMCSLLPRVLPSRFYWSSMLSVCLDELYLPTCRISM